MESHKIRRIPTKLNRQMVNEIRARALLNNRTFEEHLGITLIEWEMTKAEKEADCSTNADTVAWLPIESTLLSRIRAAAKRHGMSVRQAIAEAITEDVAFWRQKDPHLCSAATSDGPSHANVTVHGDATQASDDIFDRGFAESLPAAEDRHHVCLRLECGHRWKSRTGHPNYCPKCKSARWNEPPGSTPIAEPAAGENL